MFWIRFRVSWFRAWCSHLMHMSAFVAAVAFLSNLLSYYLLYYFSKVHRSIFTRMVVSVVVDDWIGCASFATASSSWLSLYKPTVVMYGAKYEPVTKLYTDPVP